MKGPSAMGRAVEVRPSALSKFSASLGHAYIALFAVALIALIILPIPPIGLDVVIAINIASAVLLLMLALYIPNAMSLSTFPSLILITTALRLAVNIASTKQILLNARAGEVIETFGDMVMGGQVVVGLVVFTIISVVQFIVISKGAERVAEVSARFTLDALPGRQMSIEADLRSELITKEEAALLRSDLQQETQLHGALDGAMKFVKGDAIAAIIIALVNIVGGISIGTAVQGMGLSEAVSRFTLLTVGDGMVSQIPSLMSSLAAGILATRIVGRGDQGSNLGGQVSHQITRQRSALYATAAIVGSMALIPGFPAITFLTLAVAIAGGVWWTGPRNSEEELRDASWQLDSLPKAANEKTTGLPDKKIAIDSSVVTPLQIRMATDLQLQLNPAVLDDAFAYQERKLVQTLGRSFPQTTVQFDDSLPEQTVAVDVQELEADRWVLWQGGERGGESPEAAIAARIATTVRLRPDAFVGTEELLGMVDRFREANSALHSEVMRAAPPIRILEVLKLLTSEYVSMRLLREIFEALLIWAPREKDSVRLAEHVRAELGRFIVAPLLNEQRSLNAVLVPPEIEQSIEAGLSKLPKGEIVTDGVLAPDKLSFLVAELDRISESVPEDSALVLLTSDRVRAALRTLLKPSLPGAHVLAYSSLPRDTVIVPVGKIELPGSDQASGFVDYKAL